MPKDLPIATVVKRTDLTDDLIKLWIKPPPEFQAFKPGQYCTIGVDGVERPYSIASAPQEKFVELFLELVPDRYRTEQSLTPKLWQLNVGDSLTMRPRAKGTFLFDESAVRHAMISTVTGVAPFVSMLRAMYHYSYYKEFTWDIQTYVFQGASYEDEFGYDDELRDLAYTVKNVHYIPTISRPQDPRNASWQGATGRVNTHEQYIKLIVPGGPDSMIYLCGNEGMVDDLGNTVARGGKPLGKFITDQSPKYMVRKEVFF